MKLLDLIFAIVSKFVPINPSSLAQLESEGRQWEASLEREDNKGKMIATWYIKLNKEWYMRLLWAVLFVPITQYLRNAEREDGEEEM
jgi:hypothetical protein